MGCAGGIRNVFEGVRPENSPYSDGTKKICQDISGELRKRHPSRQSMENFRTDSI